MTDVPTALPQRCHLRSQACREGHRRQVPDKVQYHNSPLSPPSNIMPSTVAPEGLNLSAILHYLWCIRPKIFLFASRQVI